MLCSSYQAEDAIGPSVIFLDLGPVQTMKQKKSKKHSQRKEGYSVFVEIDMYCLDTNIMIDILCHDKSVQTQVGLFPSSQISTTPISACELFRGAFLSRKAHENVSMVKEFLGNITILEFTLEAAMLYGKWYSELKAIGKLTQEADLLIASIAMAHQATLVTRNKKDFAHVPGLDILSW